jgi:large subunit ribosomal protein L35
MNMAKVKTRSAAKKRFKKVGNGKVKRSKAFRRHLLTKKSSKRKRQLRQTTLIHDSNLAAVRILLPY